MNPIGEESLLEEMENSIKLMLPLICSLFTKELFREPALVIRLLKDVADIYGCLPVKGDIVSSIEDASIQVDGIEMEFVWLATDVMDTQDQAKDLANAVIS